jgi:hypothetical protein
MSRGQRLTFLGIAAVIAVIAVIVLAVGGDDTDETSRSASTATPSATATTGGAAAEGETATPTPTPKPKPPLLRAGKETALTYKEGETVRFRVVSAKPEEVHVHGYDIKQDLEPGKVETMSFKATITGIFEIELEGSGTLLAQLKVVP